ncbi:MULTISPECIES: DUF2500 domain-containing protein [Streptococcus]|uniref:DUF2500 domain-containing protein n=1 Tax=Streptococcus TaxID=1301 RepID=UPI0012DCC614|nr:MULTISPECIES: DUF2500 domain-containing protein [Streptococcus]QHF55098.1 hypothetical protein BZG42_06995 [Streptococcus sp. DAT741]
MFASPDFGLTVHQMLFYVISSLILGVICFQIIKNLLEWHRNNQAPRETCSAKLVTKRTRIFGNEIARTNYYMTFDWNGQRREFRVRSEDYAVLAEGDTGTLHFQGTRFLGFERFK